MRHGGCEREQAIAAAVRASGLSGPLREHAASCAACREAAAVAGFLGALAAPRDERPLPDAGELYRRARLASRLGEPAPVERAMRRLALAEALGVSASGAALVSWLVWVASDAWRSAGTELPGGLPLPAAAATVFVLVLLGAAVPLVGMWPLLREE